MTTLTLVLPYPTKDMEYYEKCYDDIIIYEAEKSPISNVPSPKGTVS